MQVLIASLLLAVVAGNSRVGRRARHRPRMVLLGSVLLAASFYSIRVIL